MRTLVIQNSVTGPPGHLGSWLERRGARLTIVNHHHLPSDEEITAADLLVVLGSSHGVYENLPWIDGERELIRHALASRLPMIGICFGAQIIASALGAEVRPGRRYGGWIENDEVADEIWRGPWFRWHGDCFGAAEGASVLARSKETVQAFQFDRAVGLQFHPEVDAAILNEWVRIASPKALAEIDVPALLAESAERLVATTAARERLFDEVMSRTVGST